MDALTNRRILLAVARCSGFSEAARPLHDDVLQDVRRDAGKLEGHLRRMGRPR
jgi:hypothetical protein